MCDPLGWMASRSQSAWVDPPHAAAPRRAVVHDRSALQGDPRVLVSVDPAREDAAVEGGSLAAFARLHALLDSASLIEGPDELPRALEAVAAGVAETLGFENVVVNLYRPAWDDFIVSTVHGAEALRTALLGSTYAWHDWESPAVRALPSRRRGARGRSCTSRPDRSSQRPALALRPAGR